MTLDRDRNPEHPAALLQENLGLIERVIGRICRHAGLHDADADDFASVVKLALIENDYGVLRSWERRSSLAGYLTVVTQRLLADERMRTRGRWESSAEARRSGEAAIVLERLVVRDGRPLAQALPIAQAIDPSLDHRGAEAILARLPRRTPRPRPQPLDDAMAEVIGDTREADAPLRIAELQRLSDDTGRTVRGAMVALSLEDKTIVRLRFAQSMSLADISRILRLPQRPLYRRMEAILRRLRQALSAAGIDPGSASSLIGSAVQSLDFGLMEENGAAPQSLEMREPHRGAEA